MFLPPEPRPIRTGFLPATILLNKIGYAFARDGLAVSLPVPSNGGAPPRCPGLAPGLLTVGASPWARGKQILPRVDRGLTGRVGLTTQPGAASPAALAARTPNAPASSFRPPDR